MSFEVRKVITILIGGRYFMIGSGKGVERAARWRPKSTMKGLKEDSLSGG